MFITNSASIYEKGPEGTVKICINLFHLHENYQIMKVVKLVKIKTVVTGHSTMLGKVMSFTQGKMIIDHIMRCPERVCIHDYG